MSALNIKRLLEALKGATGKTLNLASQTIAGAITFSGANTHSGNNTFSGNNTLSGNNTHSGNNTFSGTNTFSSAPAINAAPTSTVDAGTAATNVTAVEYGDGVLHKTVLTCDEFSIGTAGDEAGVGQYLGAKLYDFPEGLICTLGAVIDGSVTLAAPAIDAWDGDIGLGTAAPTDHASGVNGAGTAILDSTATTQASSKVANVDAVSACTALTESGARWLDGTATAIDLFMNLLVDDDGSHDNTITGTFTGTVTIFWLKIGDK